MSREAIIFSMAKTTATVIKVSGNRASVLISRPAVCASCGGCAAFGGDRPVEMEVINQIGAFPGDIVELLVEPRQEIILPLIVFGLPLLFLVAGALIGRLFSDLFALFSSLLGLVLGLGLVRLFELWRKKDCLVKMVRIGGEDER